MRPLPIDDAIPAIVASLERVPCAVVVAPPGAGKTTRVPAALLDAPFARGRSIVMLQPRRVAARASAARIAEERGGRLGDEVGYHVRFDRRVGPRTRLRVVTEGILARRLQSDPFLEEVACVVLDEFHERSIHVDLALAMLREIQRTVREDLRIVAMSATMDPGPVANFLGEGSDLPPSSPSGAPVPRSARPAPVFRAEGRMFPVEIRHDARPLESAGEPGSGPRRVAASFALGARVHARAARAVRDALATPPSSGSRADGPRAEDSCEPHHVLVFLPGMAEIRRTESLVAADAARAGAEVHVLHGSIPAEAQDRALRPSSLRKIVLATNVAETSLTIDGVRTVIDSGLARVPHHDARYGVDRLELRRVSLASADQRAGRAGRTAPGVCVRLWSVEEEATFEAAELPDIRRVDLAATVLSLHAYGARDLARFEWFEAPAPERIAAAERLLWMLGAMDRAGGATKLGRRLAELPLHPRLGRLLLAGVEEGVAREAATLAAMLSEGELLEDSPGARRREALLEGPSDLIERLDRFERGDEGLDPGAVRRVERTRDELLRLVRERPGD